MNLRRILYSKIEPSNEPPKMAKFMVKHNIVRNEFQAMLTMFIVIIASVCLTLLFFNIAWKNDSIFFFSKTSKTADVPNSINMSEIPSM